LGKIMYLHGNLHCENCGKLVDTIIMCECDKHPLTFCSYECFNEYRVCDGGDDGCLSPDCTDDTD